MIDHPPQPQPQLVAQQPPLLPTTTTMIAQSQAMNPAQPPILGQNPVRNAVQPQILSQNPNHQMMMMTATMNNNQRNYSNKPWQFNKPRSNNWKGKNVHINNNSAVATAGGTAAYNPPSLNELQTQNRMRARKFYNNNNNNNKKRPYNNNNNSGNKKNYRFAPYAPRNTTSFLIRAKKEGGIAPLVSPCPVTPAVLPTPIFSPSREVLGDMAKEEWGVDGYGSMKGLIWLRSPGNEEDEEDDGSGGDSSDSEVEEHVEVERRLDHDLSRFEMICPSYGGGGGEYSYNNLLENRVDDQDTHIAQLEEENLTLKERLFLMERELADLRRRMHFLERQHGHQQQQEGGGGGGGNGGVLLEDANEEVVENASENDDNECESVGDDGATDDVMECVSGGSRSGGIRGGDDAIVKEVCNHAYVEERVRGNSKVAVRDEVNDGEMDAVMVMGNDAGKEIVQSGGVDGKDESHD